MISLKIICVTGVSKPAPVSEWVVVKDLTESKFCLVSLCELPRSRRGGLRLFAASKSLQCALSSAASGKHAAEPFFFKSKFNSFGLDAQAQIRDLFHLGFIKTGLYSACLRQCFQLDKLKGKRLE